MVGPSTEGFISVVIDSLIKCNAIDCMMAREACRVYGSALHYQLSRCWVAEHLVHCPWWSFFGSILPFLHDMHNFSMIEVRDCGDSFTYSLSLSFCQAVSLPVPVASDRVLSCLYNWGFTSIISEIDITFAVTETVWNLCMLCWSCPRVITLDRRVVEEDI